MALLKSLFGVELLSKKSESEDTEDVKLVEYLFTWTEMVEKERITQTIQFVSGKQKRVSYTNEARNQILEDETTDAEPVQINWDNIEYADTESVETVEVPVEKDRWVQNSDFADTYRSLVQEESVVTETIDWEEY